MKLNIKARLVRKHDNKDDLVIALDNSIRRSCLESKGASNSQFVKIATITFLCDRYDPTRAGSYSLFPEPRRTKKSCINTQHEIVTGKGGASQTSCSSKTNGK